MDAIDRFNRYLYKPRASLDDIKRDLAEAYARTESSRRTAAALGLITGDTVRNWMRLFGLPLNPRGGANNITGPTAAERINAMDQDELATMTAHEIGELAGCSGRYVQALKARKEITCKYLRKKRRTIWEEDNPCEQTLL